MLMECNRAHVERFALRRSHRDDSETTSTPYDRLEWRAQKCGQASRCRVARLDLPAHSGRSDAITASFLAGKLVRTTRRCRGVLCDLCDLRASVLRFCGRTSRRDAAPTTHRANCALRDEGGRVFLPLPEFSLNASAWSVPFALP